MFVPTAGAQLTVEWAKLPRLSVELKTSVIAVVAFLSTLHKYKEKQRGCIGKCTQLCWPSPSTQLFFFFLFSSDVQEVPSSPQLATVCGSGSGSMSLHAIESQLQQSLLDKVRALLITLASFSAAVFFRSTAAPW